MLLCEICPSLLSSSVFNILFRREHWGSPLLLNSPRTACSRRLNDRCSRSNRGGRRFLCWSCTDCCKPEATHTGTLPATCLSPSTSLGASTRTWGLLMLWGVGRRASSWAALGAEGLRPEVKGMNCARFKDAGVGMVFCWPVVTTKALGCGWGLSWGWLPWRYGRC